MSSVQGDCHLPEHSTVSFVIMQLVIVCDFQLTASLADSLLIVYWLGHAELYVKAIVKVNHYVDKLVHMQTTYILYRNGETRAYTLKSLIHLKGLLKMN